MKKVALLLIIGIFVVLASHNLNAQTQTISVDTTLTADCDLYPFTSSDSIYGLRISGSITLNCDTSLIRVILVDDDDNKYMVYEAYPLIVSSLYFNIADASDETSYFEGIIPSHLIVYVNDGSFNLQSITYSLVHKAYADTLNYFVKRQYDSLKVQNTNSNLTNRGWDWVAGHTKHVKMTYEEKSKIYGENYNLQGFEYYESGVYKYISQFTPVRSSSNLVESFDWRDRHGSNIDEPNNVYYGGTTGWITPLEPGQGACNSCTAFGVTALIEAMTNLYYNQHLDISDGLDLSEMDLWCACNGNCNGEYGILPECALNYVKNYGIVDEECYPYDPPCSEDDPPCTNPVRKIQIDSYEKNYGWESFDAIKTSLIKYGPIAQWLKDGSINHEMLLVGYEKDPETNETIWIYKDSNSSTEFREMELASPTIFHQSHYISQGPDIGIHEIIENNYNRICRDSDNDGYHNWGVDNRMENCGDETIQQDSDDSNPRIGPYDENYYGTPVIPIMQVNHGSSYIPSTTFYNFFDENLQLGQEIVMTFNIKNDGNAQLNLFPNNFGKTVELSGPNKDDFTEDLLNLQTAIPMNGGTTTFDIKFKMSLPVNEPKIVNVTINLDEDDMRPYEFTLVFSDCDYVPNYEVISSDTTWSGQMLKFTDVKVSSGATLTVTGDVAFSSGAGLHIEQGGRVEVNGGHLTSLCSGLWKGVDVWATNIKHHQFDPSTQAYIKLMNGGKISNAETGIETARFNGTTMITNTHGGIVIISEGIIENCEVGVHLFPYRNYNPVTLQPMDDLSHFSMAEFVNDKFRAPAKQLLLDKVNGIKIKGCSFEYNNMPSNLTTPIGIFSANSGFTVTYYNISQTTPPSEILPTTFKTLDYGIYATDRSTFKQIRIDNTRFEDNIKGVYMSTVNYPVIIENEFNVRSRYSPIPESMEMIGLYINDESIGFVVEENEFYSELHSSNLSDITCQGITLNHTGQQPNEIYNNSFENLSDGIIAAGENRDALGAGLCLKCNDFINSLRDISVIPGVDEYGNDITSGPTIGIAQNQGEQSNGSGNALAAGNTFSEENTELGVINYQNEVSWNDITYVYHGNNLSESKTQPFPFSSDFTPQPDPDADYTKEGSCPSHYGGGTEVNTATASLNVELNNVNAFSDTLGLFVDGGDTQALANEVNTSTEQESTELRQELLDESPYLSDTILKAIIKKEDVLPNAMVRDVLVANPQSAKSDEVLMTLSQRSDTMPGYMVNQILQGENYYGAKELLEQKLAASKTRKGWVMNDLIHHYLKDTSDLQTSNDSIQAILTRDNVLESMYQLAMKYIGMRDSSSAFGLMNDIPLNFDLGLKEEAEYELYEDLVNLQWQMFTDSTQADSLFVDELFDLYQAGLTTPCFYARNMLIGLGEISYEPPVYLPDYSKATEAKYFEWGSRTSENKWMKLFPNPAGSYFTIEYDLTSYEGKPSIKIINLSGLLLSEISLSNLKDQIIVPTENYIQGLYLVQIEMNGKMIDAGKISIIK